MPWRPVLAAPTGQFGSTKQLGYRSQAHRRSPFAPRPGALTYRAAALVLCPNPPGRLRSIVDSDPHQDQNSPKVRAHS